MPRSEGTALAAQETFNNSTSANASSSGGASKNAPSYRVKAINELSQNQTYLAYRKKKNRNNAETEKPSSSSPYTALGTAGGTFMGYAGTNGK